MSQEGHIIDNLNNNIYLATDEVKYVASTLKFNHVGNGWEKFRVDDGARSAVEYVLSIAKTVAEGALCDSTCKIRISFNYSSDKTLTIYTIDEYAYGAIRAENAFSLFMAICYVTGIKPKRQHCDDGKCVSIQHSGYFCIDLPFCVYFRDEYLNICNVKQYAFNMGDSYEILAHIKDVKLVMAKKSGKTDYVEWLTHCCKLYNWFGAPDLSARRGEREPMHYEVALTECGGDTKRVALCSFKDGKWDGGIIFLPGTEADFESYMRAYPKVERHLIHY